MLLFSCILLVIITVGAANATVNVTHEDSIINECDLGAESSPLKVPDNSADENECGNGAGTTEDTSTPKYHEEISYDNRYYMFRGDCWTISNNFESSAAITSENLTDFTVAGTFRTQNDLVGVYWNSNDPIQHPYISYGNMSDYSNVVLEFDYEMAGCMDFSNDLINIIITSNGDETYFLTMNRFIENNHVRLDFNNLTLLPGNSYIDKNGKSIVVADETKLNVSNLKSLMFELLPVNFVENNDQYTIMKNTDFSCKIFNISVENGLICNEQLPLETHQYRLCEGYDDISNLNPKRISKEMRKLGYVGWVDFYIGASYFYEKSGVVDDVIDDLEFDHNRTEKMVLDKNVPLNQAFKVWLDCYARELKKNGVENIVISVSMENLQCPQRWRQMDANGNFAMSGWVPSTFLYSPCHEDVVPYMQKVSEACLDIVANNGFKPILQLGETWWWWSENNWSTPSPCFYDNSTKEKYLKEHGSDLPEYSNAWAGEYDKSAMNWLNQQLVSYSDALRDVVKGDKYEDALFMALLFTPSVIDSDRVPPMMKDVNFLTDVYSPSKLDALQIEDYDWVIFESPHHGESYSLGYDLGFSGDNLHYFGGFVQYREDADKYWNLIEEAMDDALDNKFKEVFVWAGSQIRRDNKIIAHDENELLDNLALTTLVLPDYVSVGENFTIKMYTQEWVNGHLNVYDYNNNNKGELLVSAPIINGSSLIVLSSNVVGLNRFYLEFDYSGGEYYLIENVYVIENSQNIDFNIPLEIEKSSGTDFVFNAFEIQSAVLHISIDGNQSTSYELKNGKFSKTIADLPRGYHKISLKCDDGSPAGIKYYSNTFTFNVGAKTSIEYMDMVTYYNSGEKLSFTLKDSEGNLLKEKDILIGLNGLNHTVSTEDNGQASLECDMLPGNYSAEIIFKGEGGYLSSNASAEIVVNKAISQITAPAITTTYNVAKNLVVTLKDKAGNVLVGQNVTVKLNNKIYKRTTDVNGQIKLPVSLAAKKYVASIVFEPTDLYKSSNKSVNVIVSKATPKLVAYSKTFKVRAKTKKITVSLKSNKNKAISKTIVYLKVNKKTYKVKTNSKGIASFNVKLTKKGKYTAVYKFAGNSNYKAVSKKFKITVK